MNAPLNQLRTRFLHRLAACCLLAAALLANCATAGATEAGWKRFKQDFIAPEGRVVDAGQGGISHSEGQGYAMLLAVHYDDRPAFEQIWQWTRKNLQVRSDSLLAWCWSPETGVKDKNNASDGDLIVAWALLRASESWQVPDYLQASRKIARDIREKLVHKSAHGLVLLPGAEGFHKPEGDSINLSYWVFPALDEIGQADPAPEWEELANNGIAILQYAHFGRWKLPPDWLLLAETSTPSNGLSELFGYNAVRIPLYLLWSRRETPQLLRPYREFWGYFKGARFLPAWTNLKNDSVDSYDASAGIHRVAQWVLAYPRTPTPLKTLPADKPGYYSSVLLLLTEMAISERREEQQAAVPAR
ncbi:MAG TPA: glycosyl hydrolase family 8 [Gallionellaceae bacterium]